MASSNDWIDIGAAGDLGQRTLQRDRAGDYESHSPASVAYSVRFTMPATTSAGRWAKVRSRAITSSAHGISGNSIA